MKHTKLSLLIISLPTFLYITTSCGKNDEAVTPVSLSIKEESALVATLTDEYKAQATYQRILDDFGAATKPFVNIKSAELKHADAIVNLMNNYEIVVLSNPFKVAEMQKFSTLQEACALGVIAEKENIAIYDNYLSLDLPTDIKKVFESNRSASLNNHLPAFENCSQ